jgi:hypothetical protein
MPELLAALEVFVQQHRRFGEMDGGIDETDAEAKERAASAARRETLDTRATNPYSRGAILIAASILCFMSRT